MSAAVPLFEELRRERKLCDALLNVDGAQFPVHKLILCGSSSYFRALFTHWSRPDTKIFDIPHVSAAIMKIILDHIYTGAVSITPENLQDLFMAADRFDVPGIAQACCQAMEEKLTTQNCIAVWWLANTFHYPELRTRTYRYILRHFEELLVGSEDFLRLSVEELCNIIEEDQLNVKHESVVFEAVLRWMGHAPQQRERYFTELLPRVRVAQIELDYFHASVLGCKLVQRNPKCKDLMLTSMKFMLDAQNRGSNASLLPIRIARPRLPRAVLIATGGWSGRSPINSIETFDNRSNCWVGVANDDETPRAYHGTVFLNGSLYLIGGFDGECHFCTAHRYDLADRTWREVANMHTRRCYISVALLDGRIYAMGGYNGEHRLDTAERYTPHTNQWTMIAPMIETRSDASSAALNGKIYICGGYNGDVCLSSAECYNPEANQWTMIAEMRYRRGGLGVVAHGNSLYAVGGFTGISRLSSVEAYNPQTNSWLTMPSMLNKRSNFGLEVLDECLYVVGGYNGVTTISTVERWDLRSGVWSSVRNMHISRSALSCSVVHDLPNIADYAGAHAASPIVIDLEE